MAITYPLSIPSTLKVKQSNFGIKQAVSETESPFTYSNQVYSFESARWYGEIELVPYNYNGAADLKAFMVKLRGRFGTFLYSDPDYLARGPKGSFAGTPVVNGASQTGRELNVRGFDVSTNDVVKAGDYIQLGSGSDARLYMVLNDVDSDSSGEATLDIEPQLRSSPSDGDSVISNGAKGVFVMDTNEGDWQSNESSIMRMRLSIKERL